MNKGLTLAELMITVFILTVGILSAMVFYINAMRATEYAGDITEATSHAEYVLEEMYTQPSLANITAMNWVNWVIPVKSLPAEQISVSFVNALTDPMDVTVNVIWTRHQRQSSVTLRTQMTNSLK